MTDPARLVILAVLLVGALASAWVQGRMAAVALLGAAVADAPDAGDDMPASGTWERWEYEARVNGGWPREWTEAKDGDLFVARVTEDGDGGITASKTIQFMPCRDPLPGVRCGRYATTGPRAGRECLEFEGVPETCGATP